MKATILKELQCIIDKYFICKKQFNNLCFSSGERNYSSPFYIYYRDVELAYYSLNSVERYLFDNEFFYKTKKKWWTQFYNIVSYKRQKEIVSQKFLNKFYELHY